MRVGVLNSWLAERYLSFWKAYLRQLDVEVVHPQSFISASPSAISQVLGQVQSLKAQGVDYLLLPDIQLGLESNRGNPSPWLIDLEASLRQTVPGLPPALVVPAELSPDLAGLAAGVGQSLSQNPMTARRALERTRPLLTPQYKAPKQAGNDLVGIVAQPVLLDNPELLNPLRDRLQTHGLNLFLADKPPQELRLEGDKLGLGLELPTDLETAGMHRYFSRLGKVKGILYLHDEAYAPLPGPLRKLVSKTGPNKPQAMAGTDGAWDEAVERLAMSDER
ncbi:MAG: hypothetical protein C4331_06050 [Meiothermus sp.]